MEKTFCVMAWVNDFNYVQKDRFDKTGEVRYTIINCKENTYTECPPETKSFNSYV